MNTILTTYLTIGVVISCNLCRRANWAYLGVELKILTALAVVVLWLPLLITWWLQQDR